MTRDDLFTVAAGAGWVDGVKMNAATRTAVRAALRAAITTDDLNDAPAFFYSDHAGDKQRRMTQADAVRALMEELS